MSTRIYIVVMPERGDDGAPGVGLVLVDAVDEGEGGILQQNVVVPNPQPARIAPPDPFVVRFVACGDAVRCSLGLRRVEAGIYSVVEVSRRGGVSNRGGKRQRAKRRNHDVGFYDKSLNRDSGNIRYKA
jgi:hypothetical protein